MVENHSLRKCLANLGECLLRRFGLHVTHGTRPAEAGKMTQQLSRQGLAKSARTSTSRTRLQSGDHSGIAAMSLCVVRPGFVGPKRSSMAQFCEPPPIKTDGDVRSPREQ